MSVSTFVNCLFDAFNSYSFNVLNLIQRSLIVYSMLLIHMHSMYCIALYSILVTILDTKTFQSIEYMPYCIIIYYLEEIFPRKQF